MDVSGVLKKSPNKNSTSPENLPYIVLRNCSEIIAPIVTELFRLVLDSRQIPEFWRKSIVVLIYKKGDKTNPYNYRPISLTCALYRTFERILAKHIVEFLHKKNFFSNEQFGFLKNRSTSTQLLTVLDEFYLAIEKGEKVDVVYIDFKRAFDTVPISGLLNKVN